MSSARSRSGGTCSGHDVQVIEQIIAKRAFRDGLREIPPRGCDDANVDLNRLETADAQQRFVFECAQQPRLRVEIHVRDVFQEQRSAVRLLERAERDVAVALRAEQLRVRILACESRDTDRHERPRRTRAQLVQIARNDFLAAARFAGDEHGGLVLRDPRGVVTKLLNRSTRSERIVERRDASSEADVLALEIRRLERTLHRDEQLRYRQRLLDEIVGAEARRLDSGFHRSVSGHHDHGYVDVSVRRPLLQQRDTVRVRHPDVEQHEIRRRWRRASRAVSAFSATPTSKFSSSRISFRRLRMSGSSSTTRM